MNETGQCNGITKGGTRCKNAPIDTSGLCGTHHPDQKDKHRAAARKGGKIAGRGRQAPTTSELIRLQGVFEQLAADVLDKRVDRADAAVAIQAINGARACLAGSLKAREVEEFEQRLVEVEALLSEPAKQANPTGGA